MACEQGAPAVTSGPEAGTEAATMTIPPAFQSATPFGSDVGGTNPMFWAYDPTARYDSWLTVGLTDGHADGTLSSIGTPSNRISTDTGQVQGLYQLLPIDSIC